MIKMASETSIQQNAVSFNPTLYSTCSTIHIFRNLESKNGRMCPYDTDAPLPAKEQKNLLRPKSN
jgi:hypothetical protein